jgi:hypothetical protein
MSANGGNGVGRRQGGCIILTFTRLLRHCWQAVRTGARRGISRVQMGCPGCPFRAVMWSWHVVSLSLLFDGIRSMSPECGPSHPLHLASTCLSPTSHYINMAMTLANKSKLADQFMHHPRHGGQILTATDTHLHSWEQHERYKICTGLINILIPISERIATLLSLQDDWRS